MKRPASWYGDLGREGLPLGNGKTGALVLGNIGKEEIIFNRTDIWERHRFNGLPKLNGIVDKMREAIDAGDYAKANNMMFDELVKEKYESDPGSPIPLGSMIIQFPTEALFSDYRRMLYMDKAECEVKYSQKTKTVSIKSFISRKDDTFYYEFSANEESEAFITFDLFDDGSQAPQKIREEAKDDLKIEYTDSGIDFSVKTKLNEYGAKVRVFGAESVLEKDRIKIKGKNFRIAVKCCSGERSTKKLKAPDDFIYEEKLKEHVSLHKRLYTSADIRLCRGTNKTNEELLDEAYEDKSSPELIEKMWRFGRYLFICGTHKNGLPLPLYGLWHSSYYPMWSQNVANENVEIIYWHTNVGGLCELVMPLIDYYHSKMEYFRENAEKLFGCNGIFIGTYTTPANRHFSVFVPVILNFTGVAGWISQHFYKYYQMTGDPKTLEEKILPFMIETADFYLSYIRYGKDGKIVYYPSVSPENTPQNLIEKATSQMGHPNPVTKNAVIEIAIMKVVFTNLITLINETGKYTEYLEKLKKALSDMPEYLINEDGAVKEWATPELNENYNHRHVSHIYPLFPGEEVSKEEDPELYAAFERADDLRKLGAQSGWSLAHMASIYATMGRGERVLECLDTLTKGATLNNFFTMHNDYRRMGITLDWTPAVVQLDANMGFVNAVQKMICDERKGVIKILPAMSERLAKGSADRLRFTKGKVSIKWNETSVNAKITFTRDGSTKIRLPDGMNISDITASGGKYEVKDGYICFDGNKGDSLTVKSSK